VRFFWQVPKHARAEGMIAPSVKREPTAASLGSDAAERCAEVDTRADGMDGEERGTGDCGDRAPVEASVARGPDFASGTAAADSGEGCVLSCSDKILIWNALGMQGGVCMAACMRR
jgi:hypothetical protein